MHREESGCYEGERSNGRRAKTVHTAGMHHQCSDAPLPAATRSLRRWYNMTKEVRIADVVNARQIDDDAHGVSIELGRIG